MQGRAELEEAAAEGALSPETLDLVGRWLVVAEGTVRGSRCSSQPSLGDREPVPQAHEGELASRERSGVVEPLDRRRSEGEEGE